MARQASQLAEPEGAWDDGAAPVDLLDPRLVDDPHPLLADLRERGDGVHRSNLGFWLVTRHADVESVNRDPRFGRDLRRWEGYEAVRPFLAGSALEACMQRFIFFLDPPDHTRLRRLTARAFTPRAVELRRPRLQQLARHLVADLPDDGQVELMERFAQPFPVRAIIDILGLPACDYAQLKAWADALALAVEPVAGRERLADADAATVEFDAYLRAEIRSRRTHALFPQVWLLDQLIAAEDGGDRLSEDELVAMVLLLFIAGHETTTNLIGNGMAALARHPAELDRLRRRRDLAATAVEELLRYDPPGNTNLRVAHEDVTVASTRIRAGEGLFTWLGSANRDPRVFEHPDRLDVSRHPNPHVTFGGGIHRCLGAALARVEGQVAFEALSRRWTHVDVDERGVERRRLINMRGLVRLPLVVTR
jgi:cytochrome P450